MKIVYSVIQSVNAHICFGMMARFQMPLDNSAVPCMLQAINNSSVSEEICEFMGLCKRIQRHLIKSILPLKNTHDDGCVHAWHGCLFNSHLLSHLLTYSSTLELLSQPFSCLQMGRTSHLLFSPLASSFPTPLPSFHPNTISTIPCLGDTSRFQWKWDFSHSIYWLLTTSSSCQFPSLLSFFS